uniref:Odorant receptor n=1 Tax=Ditylenchus dipsaci TaxID=166011 RepID=A0A915ENI7_9BILA
MRNRGDSPQADKSWVQQALSRAKAASSRGMDPLKYCSSLMNTLFCYLSRRPPPPSENPGSNSNGYAQAELPGKDGCPFGPLYRYHSAQMPRRMELLKNVCKRELAPPMKADWPAIKKDFAQLVRALENKEYKNLSVKEALVYVAVAVEVACMFFIGEMIGRRNVNGYIVDASYVGKPQKKAAAAIEKPTAKVDSDHLLYQINVPYNTFHHTGVDCFLLHEYPEVCRTLCIIELFFLGLLSFCVLRLCLEPKSTSEFVLGVVLAVLLNISCVFCVILLVGLVEKNQQMLQAYISYTPKEVFNHLSFTVCLERPSLCLFPFVPGMRTSLFFNTFGLTEIYMFWASTWQVLFDIDILGTVLVVLDISFFPVCLVYLHCVRNLIRKARKEMNPNRQGKILV